MPFVPLGSRKRLEVTLDDDKLRLAEQRRRKDEATVAGFAGLAPGRSGYRFGSHPVDHGCGRPWEATRLQPSAGPVDAEAPCGGLARPRSLPSLESPGPGPPGPATFAVSRELQRLERLAATMEKKEMQGIEVKPRPAAPAARADTTQEPAYVADQSGPIQFPKYMLLHNCHLKSRDVLSFHAEQQAKAAAAAAATQASETTRPPMESTMRSTRTKGPMTFHEPSWGAPRLRREGEESGVGIRMAGNSLPAGRNQRSSNPFVTG